MSKQWMIGIGVAVGILAIIFAGIAGLAIFRAGSFMAMNHAAIAMQRSGNFEQGAQFDRQGRRGPDVSPQTVQLEVQLLDEDEDGIPDRGIVELPGRAGFERNFQPGQGFAPGGFDRGFQPGQPGQEFGRGFAPGQRPDQFSGSRFSPLAALGCLVNLAVLAGLAVLGVVLYRRWRPAQATASPVTPVSPPPSGPAAEANFEAMETPETEPDTTGENEAADPAPEVADEADETDETPADDKETAPEDSPEEEDKA